MNFYYNFRRNFANSTITKQVNFINVNFQSQTNMTYYIGIDFGHGETTVSRVPGYNGEPVSQIAIKDGSAEEEKKIISAVCKKNNKWSLVYGTGDFKSTDLREGFKAMISEMQYEDKEAMREFAKLVFQAILDNDTDLRYNPNDPNDRNFSLGIACPSDWVKVDSRAPQDYLNFFRDTCKLPIDCCIRESDAAFFSKFSRYQNTDSVFVIDIGSSTIDFTTYANSKCIEECCWGVNYGAHQIEDALLMQLKSESSIISNINKLNKFRAAKGYGNATSAISLFFRTQKERYFSEKQEEYSLMVTFKDLTVGWPSTWDICIGFKKNGPEFEQIISGYKQSIRQVLENAKNKLIQNGISLTHVLLSGGASRMPFIKKYAEDIFGKNVQIDKDPKPECVVSNGIALYAQKNDEALKNFLILLKEIDYEYIFKRAYADARSEAISQLVPTVVNEIKSYGCLSGKRIREEYLEFLKSLNPNNSTYCHLIKTTINSRLSAEVATRIASVVKKNFNIDILTADIAINTSPAIYRYIDDCFIPGGSWYTRITNWIEGASSTILASFFFDWDETKDSTETSRIAEGVSCSLKKYSPYENDIYLKLEESINNLKKQVADLAIRAFYKNQLFETTFKQ